MFMRLLMLFIMVPVAEIYLLVKVGERIGAAETIFLVIATGIAGASFARSQGTQIIFQIQQALQRGEIPGEKLVEGAMILVGGILLLTPGFITDLLGLTLLIPWTRRLYAKLALHYFSKKMNNGQWYFSTYRDNQPYRESDQPGESRDPRDIIIEHPQLEERGEE